MEFCFFRSNRRLMSPALRPLLYKQKKQTKTSEYKMDDLFKSFKLFANK